MDTRGDVVADDGSSGNDVSARSGAACEKAGGICECSCGDQFPVQVDQHNDCPQPCPTCGGCSMFCCLPDPDCDATLGCVKVCQAGDCECHCPPEKTVCGDGSCDRKTEVCVGKGPIGPSVSYACETLPDACMLHRDCGCLSSLCNEGDNCSVEEDNRIFCDNGSQ